MQNIELFSFCEAKKSPLLVYCLLRCNIKINEPSLIKKWEYWIKPEITKQTSENIKEILDY